MSENTPTTETAPSTKPDSSQGFANIFISVLIPVLILNKGSKYGLAPTQSLMIALAFPLVYGLYSLIKERKMNYIALLGLLNVLSSGILTVLALGGIWFAIKEAVFPLLIGIFVFVSSFSHKPFFQAMFLNPAAFDVHRLWSALDTSDKKSQFLETMKKATQGLSLSFLLSAILNFSLAFVIFKPLPDSMTDLEKQDLLNTQLSQMTMYSFVVIMIPILVVVSFVLYMAFKKTTQITGLKLEDLMLK